LKASATQIVPERFKAFRSKVRSKALKASATQIVAERFKAFRSKVRSKALKAPAAQIVPERFKAFRSKVRSKALKASATQIVAERFKAFRSEVRSKVLKAPATRVCGILAATLLSVCAAGAADAPATSDVILSAGRPEIRSFQNKEVLSRGPVSSFAVSSDNTLIVGSDCLSIYDGIGWRRIEVPQAWAFRALAPAPAFDVPGRERGRVWVGGVGAIGYVESDAAGIRQYVSVLPELTAAGLAARGGIWFAKAMGKSALFVAPHQIFRWESGRFSAQEFAGEARLIAGSGPGDELWLWHEGTGLWCYRERPGPALLRPAAAFPPGAVQWILPPEAVARVAPNTLPPVPSIAGTLVGTDSGVYRLNEAGFERLAQLSDSVMRYGQVAAVALDDGTIAVGSLRGGLLLARRDGTMTGTIGRIRGLRDDTVYGLWPSSHRNLWIGLDDGFDRLTSLGQASIFDARSGLNAGSPRKISETDGTLYAITSKAIYRAAPREARFSALVPFNPIFNDAIATPEGLWAGGSGGIWLAQGGGAQHVWTTKDAVTRVAALPGVAGGLVYIEDYRIKTLTRQGTGPWRSSDSGLRLNDRPVSLLAGAQGELWLSTVSSGMFRYRVAEDAAAGIPRLTLSAHYTAGSGLPSPSNRPILTRVGAELFAFTESEILQFAGARGFIAAPDFVGWTGLAGAPGPGGTAYWIVQRLGFGSIAPASLLLVRPAQAASGAMAWQPLRLVAGDREDEITDIDVTGGAPAHPETGGTAVWIGRKDGFLRLTDLEREIADVPLGVQLRGVRAGRDSRLALEPGKGVRLGREASSISFDYAPAQPLSFGTVFYQTRLEGAETAWSPPRKASFAEYTGLAPGAYVFTVRRMDRYGRTGVATRYPLVVAAPWYRQWPAQLGILGAAGLAAGYLVRRRLRTLHDRAIQLDRLVAERTRELELSNTAKSEFLETICHEIRNPLNGIVGLIGLLEDSSPEDARERLGHSLKECAAGLSQVFNEVLNFSRLESGAVDVEARPFLLAELLGAVRAMFIDGAAQHGSSVAVRLPPDFKDGFLGDGAKIRTIVNNFVGNALKYAPGSPVGLSVSCGEHSAGFSDVLIEVSDSGPGVPAEEQELIFKKFVRGSGAKSNDIMGTGIGLATCRALAKKLGGSVGIESPNGSGRGATFFLKLVLADLPGPAGTGEPSPAEGAQGWALIVEDKHYNQLVLAGIMHRLGYRMEFTVSAEQAVAAFHSKSFAVVLVDLDLPGIKGLELARQIRATAAGSQAGIIGTSGRSSPLSARRCREAGMDALVIKPLTLEAIRDALAGSNARRAAALRADG
jgi:signal transduction histidine kinase/CheY-like chemotaxis protein